MALVEYPQPYGDYVLLERLGVGGMSQIDLARKAVEDADYIRFCVIKRIKAERNEDDAFVRMFKDEARITAELNHANIAHVYDFGRQGDEYYLCLEYVPGLDLRRITTGLRQTGQRIPLPIALKVLCDVLDGLGYAHEKVDALGRKMNVVHRDVNPRNIMVSVRGEVKLIDFGVAKATNRLERTRTDHVKGKFAYMAPEQVSAEEIDHRADLFAMGLVLHEMVTGYGPFQGLSQVQIMHRLVSGALPDLPPPPELKDPAPLLAVHRKALAMKREDRYQTAAEMKQALAEVAKPLGGLATQADVAAIVATVEPDLAIRLREKAESYSGLRPSDVRTVPMPVLPSLEPGEEGSLSGSRSVSRTQMVAGGMALGVGFATIAAGTGVLVLAGVLYAVGWNPLAAPPRSEPTITEVGVGTPVPEPVEAPEPAPVVAPDPGEIEPGPGPGTAEAPSPAPAPVATPQPAPEPSPGTDTPAPEPTPIVLTVPAPEPPAPEPVVEPIVLKADPTPAPEPAPPPEPVAMGTLQVTTATKGLPIYVNGEATGHTTPAEFPWPAGEVTVTAGGLSKQVTLLPEMKATVILR